MILLSNQTRSLQNLNAAAEEFEKDCAKYLKKYPSFRQIEPSVLSKALTTARSEEDIHKAAKLFGNNIANMSQLIEEEREIAGKSLCGRVQAFLTGLYPMVNLSLSLTGAIASVGLLAFRSSGLICFCRVLGLHLSALLRMV